MRFLIIALYNYRMKNTYYSYSFGCRVNEAEKEALDRQMKLKGYKFTDINPQIYILNTCAVTQKAEREARQHINQVKRQFPLAKIVVTGCSATIWKKNLFSYLPIDLMIDNRNKDKIISIIEKKFNVKKEFINKDSYKKNSNKFNFSGRYLIKIQDGCHRFCSYCIVPYLRGNPQVRSMPDILNEIQALKDAKEIILTAINTECFGLNNNSSLIELLKTIIMKSSVSRISLGSLHPWSITSEFMSWYKKEYNNKRFVNFFHIPIQSGSNKILKLMRRDYSINDILFKVNKLKKINPNAFISTDIIVGFLNETDKDFEETYSFLKNSPFNKFHVFRFSPRHNTSAWYLKNSLFEPSNPAKKIRSERLIKLSFLKYQNFLTTLIKKQFSALVLDNLSDKYRKILLSNQVLAYLDNKKLESGDIVNVEIDNLQNSKLYGKVI